MQNSSVTNYNSYMDKNYRRSYVTFKSTSNPTVSNADFNRNSSQIIQQPDTFSYNTTKVQQKGLSSGAKWGLGTLAVASLATLAYVLSKGKVGSKQTKQLAEQIEFKESKTMDEAKKFAKENFGIKLDFEDNLFAANFINESCVNVSNAMKGKAHFPKKIDFGIINNNKNVAGGYSHISNVLTLRNVGKEINNSEMRINFYDAFNKTLKTQNSYLEYSKKLHQNNDIFNNMRLTIYHELGHCNHYAICKDYEKMGKLKELEYNFISDKSITNEFLNNKTIQETAGKISDYAKESPSEFVAETFAQLIEGKKLSEDVIALYKKYGGPDIKVA